MNHVIKNEDQAGFNFNININPVNNTHWSFLTSDSFKGTNRPRTRKEIKEQLSKSIRYLHHTLGQTKKLVLEKDDKNGNWKNVKNGLKDMYDIFNAVNLQSFFSSMLQDIKYNSSIVSKNYKYDFRTSENARLMFESSINYLINSPEFKDRKSTLNNVKQISEDFELLSKSQLSKEHELISMKLTKEQNDEYAKQQDKLFKESNIIQNKLDQIIIKCTSITNLPDSIEYDKIGRSLEQTREIILFKLTRINIEPKKTSADKKEYSKLIKEVEDIEEALRLIKKLKQNENKVILLERELYNVIENYFSPINPIKNKTEFEDIRNELH